MSSSLQENDTDTNSTNYPGDLELEMNITNPGVLELEMKEVGEWDTLMSFKQFEMVDDEEIKFQFGDSLLIVRKSGNDHLVPQIQNLLKAEINKFDYDQITIGDNTESLEFDIVDEKLVSSNDVLACYNMPAHLVILAVAVFALQVAVLALVISSSYNSETVAARSSDLILVRIFISYYLSLHLADAMSTPFKGTICEMCSAFSCVANTGSWGERMINVIVAPFAMSFVLLVSLVVMIYYWKDTNRALFFFSIVAESVVQFAMLVATGIITKQQKDIVSSIFNFVGLLLILELDELAVKTTSFTIKSAAFNTGKMRDAELAKFVTSIWLFTGIVIYLLI
jgi:hypothetical protein